MRDHRLDELRDQIGDVDRQLVQLIARSVAAESPQLYFEIQALNAFGGEALAALGDAVERLRSIVAAEDEPAFVKLMQRGREYLPGLAGGERRS